MSTNRELYFKYQKQGIPDSVIYFALQESCNLNNLDLLRDFDQETVNEKSFVSAMERYQNGEMIEYIFNKTYFLKEPFFVNKDVLIPRQETEQLVLDSIKLIKDLFGDKQITIADVCTGSGVIGISIAKQFLKNRVILTDISKEALEVAKENAHRHSLNNVELKQGDMLEPLINGNKGIDVLLCNPPYIENIETIDKKTWEQEPHLALLAKPATLFYEKILKDLDKIVSNNWLLCFEIGEDMEESLTKLIKKYYPSSQYSFKNDIYGKRRFLYVYSINK